MNGYFQLVTTQQGTGIRVYAPTDGGEPLQVEEALKYLDFRKIEYDVVSVNNAVKNADGQVVLFTTSQLRPERESYRFDISDDRMQATAFFYAPSEGAELMTPEELLKDLIFKKIRFGIQKENIEAFFARR